MAFATMDFDLEKQKQTQKRFELNCRSTVKHSTCKCKYFLKKTFYTFIPIFAIFDISICFQ